MVKLPRFRAPVPRMKDCSWLNGEYCSCMRRFSSLRPRHPKWIRARGWVLFAVSDSAESAFKVKTVLRVNTILHTRHVPPAKTAVWPDLGLMAWGVDRSDPPTWMTHLSKLLHCSFIKLVSTIPLSVSVELLQLAYFQVVTKINKGALKLWSTMIQLHQSYAKQAESSGMRKNMVSMNAIWAEI